MRKRIGIVGSGPAGLMAASQILLETERLKKPAAEIHLFEKRPGLGRKLLIAGSSGLNVSHDLELEEFAKHYQGFDLDFWKSLLSEFGVDDWLQFIKTKLELETFLGTSNRYFVKEMKASTLIKNWTRFLQNHGVQFHAGHELADFSADSGKPLLSFLKENQSERITESFDAVAFFLGGGSWESTPPRWPELFRSKGIQVSEFIPSNVGYEVKWNPDFLKESEGKPLKKIDLTTRRGTKRGELVITEYGIEGTPVYFCGTPGTATLDLKPDLSREEILRKLTAIKENLSPMRRVKKKLSLSQAAESLLFHHSPRNVKEDLPSLIDQLKAFRLELLGPRPLVEAISSRGGVCLSEINRSLELKSHPGIHCGGEMLDWDAPTGGFLIQASISQGALVGRSLA